MKIIKTLLAVMLLTPMSTFATEMTSMTNQEQSDAKQSYADGMEKMHNNMMEGMQTDNPDIVFAQGMTAHHQGAIDMANTELQYGKDPDMLKLAQEIIAAQQPEIQLMQNWLKSRENK